MIRLSTQALDDSCTGAKIAASAIVASHIAANAVVGAAISAGVILASHIANAVIMDAQIATNAAIAYSKLALSGLLQASDFAAGIEGDAMVREIPGGTVNGTNVLYTLANTPRNYTLQLVLNGIHQYRQAAATDNTGADSFYMASSNALILTCGVAPAVADLIEAYVYN